ncbi:MAG TPA: SIMPL domain-containing protein [Alcanivoracaceae bacterium]|nr:SIMPL domain-containing protein [Alcanivoracaceae bacterium]
MLKRVSTAALILGAVALTACSPSPTPNTEQVVQVTGYGEVKATPNQFHVQATASRVGPVSDIASMKTAVDKEVAQALQAAKELGVDERNITAMGFSVQPEWEYQPKRKLIGQRVQRNMQFIVDGVDDYADILQALSNIGFTQITNGGATLSNPEAASKEALEKAVADAEHKAKTLAKASGRKLGPALQINEQGGHQPIFRAMAAKEMASDSSAQFSPGEITINQNVNIIYQLK